MSKSEPKIKFSNEESKEQIRARIGTSVLSAIELTRSVVKTSETSELFRQSIKNFSANEPVIEASCDKLRKVDIIAAQLNYQVNALKADASELSEICRHVDSIQKKINVVVVKA